MGRSIKRWLRKQISKGLCLLGFHQNITILHSRGIHHRATCTVCGTSWDCLVERP